MKVFISHSSRNRQRAMRLAEAIQHLNVEVWYDEWEILVGHNLADQIYEGIKSCDYMLILLTNASVTSTWVKEEMNYARTSEIESGGTKIVPLLYEDCEIPSALRQKAYADFRNSFERGFEQLSRLLSSPQPSSTQVTDIFYEIELPLRSHGLVVDLLYRGLAYVRNYRSKEDYQVYLQDLKLTVEVLSEQALRLKVDRRCYAWLNEALSMLQDERILENWEEHRSTFFDIWYRGVTLYFGGLAQKLSLKARVAQEIGRMLERVEDRAEWLADFRSMYAELQFSEQFFKLVISEDAQVERVTDALILELGRLHDYKKLRIFHQKRIRVQGIWAGFQCVLAFLFLAEPEDKVAEFSTWLSESAQYVLAEMADFATCQYMLTVAAEVLAAVEQDKGDIDGKIYDMYIRLFPSARAWAQSSPAGKSFLLGYELGICLIEKEIVVASYLQEIETLATQLSVPEPMMDRLQNVLYDLFYNYEQGVALLVPLITDLAESFRAENMDVDDDTDT
jgi:hypothetical protein